MARKMQDNSKRLSLVIPDKTYKVISALSQMYGMSMNDVVNNVLNVFAAQNLAAVKEVEEMKKSAQDKYPLHSDLAAQNLAAVKEVEVDGEGGESRQ